ncbi:MAG: HNH endonuclease signature motif containing protein, partial [Acidimicrobiales bacterium]
SVKAIAGRDEATRYAEIRRARFFRHWTDLEGAFHIHTRLTPDAGADVLAAVKARAQFASDEARLARVEAEPNEAYEADALVALVTGDHRIATFHGNEGGRTRSATIYFHVSLEALRRRRLEPGELCEIPGVGPVPLTAVENLIGEATAKLVITDGVDVTTVCHLGRTVPAHVETALEARDRICVVPGCDISLSLEIDHWKVPFARGGPSALWNLARICRFHHQLKTYEGWELLGGPGHWQWSPPPGRAGPGSADVPLPEGAQRPRAAVGADDMGGWP